MVVVMMVLMMMVAMMMLMMMMMMVIMISVVFFFLLFLLRRRAAIRQPFVAVLVLEEAPLGAGEEARESSFEERVLHGGRGAHGAARRHRHAPDGLVDQRPRALPPPELPQRPHLLPCLF